MTLRSSRLRIALLAIPLLWFMTGHRQVPRTLDANPHANPFPEDMNGWCDISRGRWMPNDGVTYYTSASCHLTTDRQNRFEFGRLDSEFLEWRWKPDGCELPKVDPHRFLELVRGKSMAFVGDSIARNQMHSLRCILAVVDYPEDVSEKHTHSSSFPRWYFPRYDFTVASFWAPFLVKATTNDSSILADSTVNMHLDEPDLKWASEIENCDIVIVSASHWMFHQKVIFREKGQILGCTTGYCERPDTTNVSRFKVIQKVLRTTFDTLLRKRNYQGITFFRTFSLAHREWGRRGTSVKARPVTARERSPLEHEVGTYSIQVEEFMAAKKAARKRALKFRLLDTMEMTLTRPEGHPNFNGGSPRGNRSIADCVHMCLPGPIDTWNELLQYHLMS